MLLLNSLSEDQPCAGAFHVRNVSFPSVSLDVAQSLYLRWAVMGD
jgi:hypothetical protein